VKLGEEVQAASLSQPMLLLSQSIDFQKILIGFDGKN
jgi:hypothetical protein